jgi:hypothetical protein
VAQGRRSSARQGSDELMFRSVPTLTHRHVALPVGEYTGTLRQPIMSVDVRRP